MPEKNYHNIHDPGEVKAEMAQGFRNAVQRGEISADEANRRFNQAARELNILAIAFPDALFETQSTQFEDLVKESTKLKALKANPDSGSLNK